MSHQRHPFKELPCTSRTCVFCLSKNMPHGGPNRRETVCRCWETVWSLRTRMANVDGVLSKAQSSRHDQPPRRATSGIPRAGHSHETGVVRRGPHGTPKAPGLRGYVDLPAGSTLHVRLWREISREASLAEKMGLKIHLLEGYGGSEGSLEDPKHLNETSTSHDGGKV